jgi:TolB-like protein/DNA-binding winged helix-turn-helix (wHTH) protein/Tfp pilus assembly protein PilF
MRAQAEDIYLVFRFADVEVCEAEFSVARAGRRLPVEPKAFKVLLYLLHNPGRLIPKDELLNAVWGDTAVTENSLTRSIALLRHALGDDPHQPRYVETVATIGYRFICPVEVVEHARDKPDAEVLLVLGNNGETKAVTGSDAARASAIPPKESGIAAARPAAFKTRMGWAAAAVLGASAIVFSFNIFGLRDRVIEKVLPTPKIESIAVLPLDSLSHDPDQEYFADGMTDALLTDLGRIKALRVISRQSIIRYKGSRKPLPEIARELNVDAIVEGTVQRSGDKVRITAQLLQGKTDRHLWAESYERDFRDVLSLQGEVAQDIAQKIEVRLSPEETHRITAARAVNPEAYEAYLKGRFQYYSISKQGLDEAERYFQLALEKDPNYALAYAGLADVWTLRTDSGHAPPSEMMPKANSALLKALQLDPNLPEAHVALANMDFTYKRDWISAEKEFRRGIELNPSSQDAHFFYADYLIYLKRNQEWQSEIQKALALDPMSSFTRTFYGWQLVYLGRCDEAIDVLQKVAASDPAFASAHMGLWGAYYKKHLDAQAMQEAVRFFEAIHDQETTAALNAGYQQAGYKEGMKRGADLLALRAQRQYVPAIRIARLYAHAGETNRAILWLQKADEARETPLCRLGVGWDWDSLRSDSRFQEIMRHMNFPPLASSATFAD